MPRKAPIATAPLPAWRIRPRRYGRIYITYSTGVKTTPTITWAAPANLTFGTALSGTQLNATASVPGTFVYTPPAGTVLPVGAAQSLSVTFTPTDTVSYTTATKTVAITVVRATPAITWAAPANLTFGTPLSGTQLNATASVAGTFVYAPPAGTVLPVGAAQSLSVTFTPTNTASYTTAAKSVSITVTGTVSPSIALSATTVSAGEPSRNRHQSGGARLVGIRTKQAGAVFLHRRPAIAAIAGILISPTATIYYDTGLIVGLKGFVIGL